MRITVPKLRQFNISLTPELDQRIDELAAEFKMERTKIGADIILTFIEHWAALQEKLRETKRLVEQDVRQSIERPGLVTGHASDEGPVDPRLEVDRILKESLRLTDKERETDEEEKK